MLPRLETMGLPSTSAETLIGYGKLPLQGRIIQPRPSQADPDTCEYLARQHLASRCRSRQSLQLVIQFAQKRIRQFPDIAKTLPCFLFLGDRHASLPCGRERLPRISPSSASDAASTERSIPLEKLSCAISDESPRACTGRPSICRRMSSAILAPIHSAGRQPCASPSE